MTEHNDNEFNASVQAEVERILSSREEAQARQEAENALEEAKETFEALKASLEAKDAKIKEYEDAFAALDNAEPTSTEVATNERIVELEKEVEEWKHTAEIAQAALDTLAREETAAGRMAELAEAGVVLDEEAAEAQYAKVREMSDEDFASYMSELVALKSKYASSSEEDGEENLEVNELSDKEISSIAQSLGCDPEDSKCISLVNEVAQKVAEVSNDRRKPDDTQSGSGKETSNNSEDTSNEITEESAKETASTKKLTLSEAITRSMDQEITPSESLREEMTQAWEGYIAEKREKKDSN